MPKLNRITIKGYKSIQDLQNFKLTDLNILLGANGAGKSNFISVFKFLANMYEQNLQDYVQTNGGPDALLHYGRKKTKEIEMGFYFTHNGYEFSLKPTLDNRLIFKQECLYYDGTAYAPYSSTSIIGSGHGEAMLRASIHRYAQYIKPAVESWRVYHFHDTSDTASVKQIHSVNDNLKLKTDAGNLAAFLMRLKRLYPDNYQQIVNTIRLVAPFFHDFVERQDVENVQLEWFERGNPDTPFKAHVLSDGTLRFICLATLLLQPFHMMNDTVLIDEPELGLHPYALAVLADLIKRASEKKQLIISTQSIELIDHFSANDIVVVDRGNDSSTFNRLSEERLKDWLEDYSLGDLWKQNIIGGRPSR
ncbi:AAA family ATPase [Methylomonas sp. EFPC3]|uniref:AAA family ATPase n=1 Tax=Methylomonas sp. EFPC3 TaxID=3021710 RepID=UPI0024176C3E|nr:AAA family ATPase [Methylomonas sp. EFPC3]WFP49150.1 AAA family ATPase [Methylomonas sp. EFPC3]